MCRFRTVVVVAISAVVAWMLATYPADPTFGFLRGAGAWSGPQRGVDAVNRARKSDRVAVKQTPHAQERTIATVELIGLRDPAIIYRDRDGRVLFQTDPVTNVTVIAKGVVLPEITVRETSRSATRPVPSIVPSAANSREPSTPPTAIRRKPQTKPTIPEGCDPAASPIASPELSHLLSKCMVEAPSAWRLAALE